ncbi:MAG: sensor histidine kinase [Myxococcota bacterium]
MNPKRIRLSIKLSTFTTMMVVLSMLLAFSFTQKALLEEASTWVLVFSGVSFVIGLFFTLFLDRVITIPVQRLVDYTSSMLENDFQEAAPAFSNDEIGSLASSIDALRRSFLAQRRSLTELNARLDAMVATRTAELEQALQNLQAAQEELVQAEKMASIGRLAGGIAHEINNPAGVIQTHAGLLLELSQEQSGGEELRPSLEIIDRQVQRISKITRDLLIFSRRAPVHARPINLSEVLALTVAAYQQKACQSQVTLELSLVPGVQVLGEPSALEQVFSNLIKNALDALEGQGGHIWVRLDNLGEKVMVELQDSGPGIPAEVLPKIFDPFFTTKRIGKGTGLGLAISYGIMKELGGSLEVSNMPSGGAMFVVGLRPVELKQAPFLPPSGATSTSGATSMSGAEVASGTPMLPPPSTPVGGPH